MDLEIKGSAVKYVKEYVKNKFPEYYGKWIDALPQKSRKIMETTLLVSEWYSLENGLIRPIKTLAQLTNLTEKEIAYASGKYSLEEALNGIYKVFIAIANPKFVMSRAPFMFETFYKQAKVSVPVLENNRSIVRVSNFPVSDKIFDYRIASWIQSGVSRSTKNKVNVSITASTSLGDSYSEFLVEW